VTPYVDVRCNHETCRDRGVYQMVGYCKNCRTPDLLLLCTMTHEAPFNAVCPVCECAAVRATRLATTDEMCIPVLVVTPEGEEV
jgi:hypothetical protein